MADRWTIEFKKDLIKDRILSEYLKQSAIDMFNHSNKPERITINDLCTEIMGRKYPDVRLWVPDDSYNPTREFTYWQVYYINEILKPHLDNLGLKSIEYTCGGVHYIVGSGLHRTLYGIDEDDPLEGVMIRSYEPHSKLQEALEKLIELGLAESIDNVG